ncbi:hypothetical protein IDSA_06760 [Pseudidiomarina salinarum]|uniref:Uncharacterized protein n=1 Tax=Pseudidiomarina salinarum TaxID=435908 RepID=A0A094IUH0_9GAMM|nr:hypothetical protein [Pseudidiomarina salinarum]KFZ30787.1 hypothetical protein IDSA_06760 [Pseudidiomarina salinarum]RUO71254.1 hypothetical protein CWI79_07450 [Pseudidiomarina salinarum]
MLAPIHIITQIADCAEWADRLVRADLIKGFIVTENDYTSNFTSAFRREINSRNIPEIAAHSQTLSPKVERSTGTDGCIIFRNNNQFKIGLFEAKWPRFSTHINYWDSLQKKTLSSHFDDQLQRQHHLSDYAIWEMFYSEEPYGANPLFPTFGSSCIWHADVFAASSSRSSTSTWTDAELKAILSASGKGIRDIVTAICSCTHGKVYSTSVMHSLLEELGIKGEVLVVQLGESHR